MGNCGSKPEEKKPPPAKQATPKPAQPKPTPAAAPKAEPKKEEPKPAPEPKKEPVPEPKEAPKPEPVPEPKEEKAPEPEPVKEEEPEKPAEPVPEPEPTPAPEEKKEEPAQPEEEKVTDDSMSRTAPEVIRGSPIKQAPPEPEKKKRVVHTLDLEGVKARISTDTAKYTLGERLGKGAYGTVVRAKNNETGEVVAVKRVSKALLAKEGEAGEKRLYREVAIMGSLNHPNLVNLNELLYKEADNEMWIVVEFVKGKELMQKITQETKLDEDTARDYFQQLVVGLNYVHSQGVVHRDLKPENILLTDEGVCKITDFGLSNIQNTDTMGAVPANLNMQTCCGTPYYVAPEVVTKPKGYSGFTADVWSLGIILYVMLVGDLPFTAKELNALLKKIGKGDYTIPPEANLSEEAKDLIAQILNPKAHKRVKISEIAEHPWFVKGGFDKTRLEVKDKLDEKAVEALTATMDSWGAAKKQAEESKASQAQTMALGRGGDNREKYEEMVRAMKQQQ
eukprot:TRINITY_DN20285_c0_g2_i1.p1 TRINITY_DN20285_c0_g2~~TRINITY_DN20285_c0_g2_i1.p1  ORF type:complete len:527 (+),score=237.11 TRINITY_DN20285_c0_g2_i1:63-1583(+)